MCLGNLKFFRVRGMCMGNLKVLLVVVVLLMLFYFIFEPVGQCSEFIFL